MNLKAGLWQQQTLKLSLTQELTQAIALLQYSAQELSAFLDSKALENPLLQIDSGNVQAIDPQFDRLKAKRTHIEKDKKNWIEQIGERTVTLDEYLLSQLNLKELDPKRRKIINRLIQSIDENGYLRTDTEEITAQLQVSSEEVKSCIAILQDLEPIGIAARTLNECLLIQLRKKEQRNPLAEKIIDQYFLLFAEKKWKELEKKLEIDLKDIQKIFDEIQTLNPRPGAIFQNEKPAFVVPDVIISWDGFKGSVSVWDQTLPKISFNERYYQQLISYKDTEVSRFLREKQQDYEWLVRSLEQRKETIIKVALKIIEKQPDFFRKGPQALKPMTMKEISEELGIHESTVSRAVREKYAQTPYGTIELKSFFTSTIQTVSNEDASSSQVKNMISRYILAENKSKPLSDQEIVRMLEDNEGIVVSRRTVAKYRDQLGIASSSKRKRYE